MKTAFPYRVSLSYWLKDVAEVDVVKDATETNVLQLEEPGDFEILYHSFVATKAKLYELDCS